MRYVKKEKRPKDEDLDPDKLEEFLNRIGNGETPRAVCKEERMFTWNDLTKYRRRDPEFNLEYAHALWRGLEAWAFDLIDIANDESRDYYRDENGRIRSDNTAVLRDKLKIETMKWVMTKLAPHLFGVSIKEQAEQLGGNSPQINIVIEKVGDQQKVVDVEIGPQKR